MNKFKIGFKLNNLYHPNVLTPSHIIAVAMASLWRSYNVESVLQDQVDRDYFNIWSESNMSEGKLIVVEGQDGSGKTSIASELASMIQDLGHKVMLTREPGGTVSAEGIRNIILHGVSKDAEKTDPLTPLTELHLINAARAQHMNTIKKSLDEGYYVVCDRWTASTLVYQGYLGGLDLDFIKHQCHALENIMNVVPWLWVHVNVDPHIAFQRKMKRGLDTDRMDTDTIPEQIRCSEAFSDAVGIMSRGNVVSLYNNDSFEECKSSLSAIVHENITKKP